LFEKDEATNERTCGYVRPRHDPHHDIEVPSFGKLQTSTYPSEPWDIHISEIMQSFTRPIRSGRPLATLRQSRKLHLAPPFLLDDYIPRYQLLSSIDASKKRSAAYAHLRNCNLCPRLCGVNRYEKTGVCLIGAETVKVNVIAPHFGEVSI
jgi:uncharacterized Fe-S radical SAM superfamily protein PflX